MKKGQGLEMNVIVVAALALVVLLVLLAIYTGKISLVGTTSHCENRGGSCVERGACSDVTVGYQCKDKEKVCCIDPTKIT